MRGAAPRGTSAPHPYPLPASRGEGKRRQSFRVSWGYISPNPLPAGGERGPEEGTGSELVADRPAEVPVREPRLDHRAEQVLVVGRPVGEADVGQEAPVAAADAGAHRDGHRAV